MSLNRDCTVLCYEILHLTTIAKNCVQMVAIYQKRERERKKNVTPKVDSFLAQDSSWRGPIRYGPPTVSRNSLHSCRKNKFRPWFPITLLLLRINMELEIWIMFKSCKKSLECPHGSKFEKKSRYFRKYFILDPWKQRNGLQNWGIRYTKRGL